MKTPSDFSTVSISLPNLSRVETLAKSLSQWFELGDVVYLQGELGAGKTTLTRHCLQAMGVTATITSPTYTLVEPYETDNATLLHMDLYRLSEPEELEFMGIRDLFSERTIAFVEWPERGEGFLPQPSIKLALKYDTVIPADGDVEMGRRLTISVADKRLGTLQQALHANGDN